MMFKQCLRCGKDYPKPPTSSATHWANSKFCSWPCRSNPVRKCETCGVDVKVRGRLRLARKTYCSGVCTAKAQPHYRGGISKENNPSMFSHGQRQRIWRRDNAQCRVCRDSGKKLVVHHRTFKKEITTDENLILLCRVCHMAVHYGKLLIESVTFS